MYNFVKPSVAKDDEKLFVAKSLEIAAHNTPCERFRGRKRPGDRESPRRVRSRADNVSKRSGSSEGHDFQQLREEKRKRMEHRLSEDLR